MLKKLSHSFILYLMSFAISSSVFAGSELVRSTDPSFFTKQEVQNHLAKVAWQGKNLAYTDDSNLIPIAMTAFAKQMPETIFELVPDKLYHISGFQLASTLVAIGNDGLIIVDPGENDVAAKASMDAFKKFSNLPVKAIIYSHRHPDHAFGSAGWNVTEEQVKSGQVKVIASVNFIPNLVNDVGVVGSILTQRTAYASVYMPPAPEGRPAHYGLGPDFSAGEVSFYMPTDIVQEGKPLKLNVSGVELEVFHAYGDAGTDEVDVYFPQYKHVHGSETVQGETFPNLYTLRGTSYRDVQKWYEGVDILLSYAAKSDSYSGSHMRAWVGHDFINERIRNYRDAMQYVHDQSVYYMNRGVKRDELAEKVILPEYLANDPWLGEYYGTVAHSVRNIYNGYLGWFQGDATELARPAVKERAEKYLSAMGGLGNVKSIAQKAIDDEDYGWAMDILTFAVTAHPDNQDVRDLKALAMKKWAYQQTNIYWRGFAISGSLELDGSIDRSVPWNFANPSIVKVLPALRIIETARVNLNAQRARSKDVIINIEISDTGEKASYTVRNQIAIFKDGLTQDADATLKGDKLAMLNAFTAFDSDGLTINGDMSKAESFFSLFDKPVPNDINLSLPN